MSSKTEFRQKRYSVRRSLTLLTSELRLANLFFFFFFFFGFLMFYCSFDVTSSSCAQCEESFSIPAFPLSLLKRPDQTESAVVCLLFWSLFPNYYYNYKKKIFAVLAHLMLRVSYCDHTLSVFRRRPSLVVNN